MMCCVWFLLSFVLCVYVRGIVGLFLCFLIGLFFVDIFERICLCKRMLVFLGRVWML